MKSLCFCMLLPVLLSLCTQAQIIDGSLTPDLIPDSVAYRLVFLSLGESSKASLQQKAHQHAKLSHFKLTDADQGALIAILAQFEDEYTRMVSTFNHAVSSGQTVDSNSLHEQRDELVQNTRNLLAASLSAGAMLKLDNFVQTEKHNMKLMGGAK